MINIAIVLPTFNEEKRIGKVLSDLKSLKLPVFVVNDGSKDNTLNFLESYSKRNKFIKLYSHRINLGKGAAIRTGCEAAFSEGYEAIIMMDSDGQHSVSDIEKFIEKLNQKKYDIVLGSRNLDHGVPLVRYLGNKFASVLISLLFGIYVSDILSGFRAITKKAFKKLKLESSGYGIETEIIVKIAKHKLKVCEVPVQTIYFDKNKGVTILDSAGILLDVFRWRIYL